MKFKLIITTLLFVLALVGIAASPVTAATVGGAVIDANGNPVVGAVVSIQQIDVPRGQRAYVARIESGRGGRYVFDGIPGGHFVLQAQTRAGSTRGEATVRANGSARVQLTLPGRRAGGGDIRD